MRAFEVYLNGQKMCTAGIDEDGVVSVIVNRWARGGEENVSFSASGLISGVNQHVAWIRHQPLQVGDVVQIGVVEASSFDEPKDRKGPEEHRKSKEEYVRRLMKELGWA